MTAVETDYDVVVLGGGSAGTSAGAAAVAAGARTLVVNDGEVGGLCILRGCMPTKAMLHSAELYEELRHLEPVGVAVGQRSFDFGRIMARKAEKVARFQRAKASAIERAGYEFVEGRARFVDAETVAVGERRLRARKGYVLATGSIPACPPIEGAESVRVWTSDDVMEIEAPPRSIVILGSGAIGLEFAWFFARLGTRVTLVNRSMPLSRIDPEFGPLVEAALAEHEAAELIAPARIERVEPDGEGIRFSIDAGGRAVERTADAFLCAIGRRPDVDGLGLEAAGVALDGDRVVHDLAMRTTNARIHVAGDAKGTHQILHLSNQEGRVAGWNAAGGSPPEEQDYRLLMEVVFTDPPFATVGLTEAAARERGIDLVVARKRFTEQGRAIVMEARHGLAKLLADRASRRIVGCQILGPRADDLIHVPATLMHFDGSIDDIGRIPWYHPTLTEAFIELGRQLAASCKA